MAGARQHLNPIQSGGPKESTIKRQTIWSIMPWTPSATSDFEQKVMEWIGILPTCGFGLMGAAGRMKEFQLQLG
eukprot:2017415-Karenia_brevis.AAC.1